METIVSDVHRLRSEIESKISSLQDEYEVFDDSSFKLDDKFAKDYLNNISKMLLKQSDLDKLKNGTLKKIYFMVYEHSYGDYIFTIYYKKNNFILTNNSQRRMVVDFEVLAKLIDTPDCSHAREYGMEKFNDILKEMPLLRTHDNEKIITYDWIQYQHWYGGEADPQDSGISYEEADNEWWWGERKDNYINDVIPIKEDDIDKKYKTFPSFEKVNSWGHGGANHYHGKRSMKAINDYLHKQSKGVDLSGDISFNLFEKINIIDEDLENFKKDKLIFFDTLYNDVYDDPYIIKLVEVSDNGEEVSNMDTYKEFLNDVINKLNTLDKDIKKKKDDKLISWFDKIGDVFNEDNKEKLIQFFKEKEITNMSVFLQQGSYNVYSSLFSVQALPNNYNYENIEFKNKQFWKDNLNLLRLVIDYIKCPNPNKITSLDLERLSKLEKLI